MMIKSSKAIKYAGYAAIAYGVYRTFFTQIDNNGNTTFALFNNGVTLDEIYSMMDASFWLTNAALVVGGIVVAGYIK